MCMALSSIPSTTKDQKQRKAENVAQLESACPACKKFLSSFFSLGSNWVWGARPVFPALERQDGKIESSRSTLITSSYVFSDFPQCQYIYLHQCVRDVLRARKLRNEQENPLFPIYENVNPEYHRGKSYPRWLLDHLSWSKFFKVHSVWKLVLAQCSSSLNLPFLLLSRRRPQSSNREERQNREGYHTRTET